MESARLKQARGSMWGSGPFEEIEVNLADMHDAMVSGIDPSPDEAWLDLGCGTGGVTGRAAAAGAKVTGVDLAPALIETARRRAEEAAIPSTTKSVTPRTCVSKTMLSHDQFVGGGDFRSPAASGSR